MFWKWFKMPSHWINLDMCRLIKSNYIVDSLNFICGSVCAFECCCFFNFAINSQPPSVSARNPIILPVWITAHEISGSDFSFFLFFREGGGKSTLSSWEEKLCWVGLKHFRPPPSVRSAWHLMLTSSEVNSAIKRWQLNSAAAEWNCHNNRMALQKQYVNGNQSSLVVWVNMKENVMRYLSASIKIHFLYHFFALMIYPLCLQGENLPETPSSRNSFALSRAAAGRWINFPVEATLLDSRRVEYKNY